MTWGDLIAKGVKKAGAYAAERAGDQIIDNHLEKLKIRKKEKGYGYGESGSAKYARKPMDIEEEYKA